MFISSPRTYEYVTLYGKRDFADVIKVGILRWGDYPGSSGGLDVLKRVFLREKLEEKA